MDGQQQYKRWIRMNGIVKIHGNEMRTICLRWYGTAMETTEQVRREIVLQLTMKHGHGYETYIRYDTNTGTRQNLKNQDMGTQRYKYAYIYACNI